MRTLDNIKSGQGRLCLPCIYNSGRKACVRVNLNEPNLIHISIESEPGRPYQGIIDGYLHVDVESLESQGTWNCMDDCKKAIDLINKHFFSRTLIVFSDDKAVVDKWLEYDRPLSQWLIDIYDALTDRQDSWIREITGKLNIKERLSNAFQAAKKQKKRVEVLEVLKDAHLGGSWQNYSDEGWLKEAEKMSESKIYLA